MAHGMKAPAAILITAILAGCTEASEPLPPEWKGRDLRQPGWTNSTLPPEWSLVLEYPLSGGTKLDWNWFSHNEKILYFQVLQSQGQQQAKKMVARHFAEDDSSVTTPQGGVYQIVWMNDSIFDVTLTWKAREGALQKMYPPNEGPGCVLLAASAC